MKGEYLMVVLFLISSVAIEAASWCRNTSALNRTERTICSSSTLRSLDDEMVRAYGAAKARRGDLSQRRWLRNVRNGCGSDMSCLRRVYRDRISELRQISHSSHRTRSRKVPASDIRLRSEGYTTFGNIRAKIVKFGGYSTPECRLAISTSGRYFYLKKMHSTCWKGPNRNGVKIICNSNKSVCKTRSELITYVRNGTESSGERRVASSSQKRRVSANEQAAAVVAGAAILYGAYKVLSSFAGSGSSSSSTSRSTSSSGTRHIANLGMDAPSYDWDKYTVWYKNNIAISDGSHIWAKVTRTQGCYSLLVGSIDSSISGNCSNCSSNINNYWSCHANGSGGFSIHGNQGQAANGIVGHSR